MEKYLKEWENFLSKNKYQIYVDMDNVLTNFADSALQLMNAGIKDPNNLSPTASKAKQELGSDKEFELKHILQTCKIKPIRNYMYKLINNNKEFWSNLPWLQNGQKLWNFVKQYNPIILSSPTDSQSIEGKKEWITKNLNLSLDKAIFEKDKFKYANSSSILIDDYEKNINLWKQHEGIGILYSPENIDNVIQEITNLFKET